MSVTNPGEPSRRIRMPAMSEMSESISSPARSLVVLMGCMSSRTAVMPHDYPVGGFVSNMNKVAPTLVEV